MNNTLIYLITFIILGIALFGSAVGLPLSPLVVIGTGIFGILTNFSTFKVSHLLIFTVIITLAVFSDNVLILLGAKKFGASKKGLLGAFLGGIFGLIAGGPIGLLIGPFIGATLFELSSKRKADEAIKSGLGAVLGVFMGAFLKFLVVLSLIIWFLIIIY